MGVWHTPDFFVLRHKEAGWEEWKTVKELSKLAVKMPHRYIKDDLNQWRCPPGEFYAESLGLYYRLRTDAEINWTLQNNLQFLEDYFRGTSVVVEAEQESLINSLIIKQPGITLAELVNKGCSPDSIYTLLALQKLEINLQSANLVQNPELVRVFLKGQKKTVKEQSKREPHNVWFVPYVGQKLVWNGRRLEVINPGQTQTALTTDEDKIIQIPNQELSDLVKSGAIQVITATDTEAEKIKRILDSASTRDCTEANRRYQIIADYLSGEKLKEFSSVYFERLLAMYECTSKTRPGGKPRFGSVCERLFGTTNTMFIHNLAGNTQITKNPRSMTRATNPRRHAIWTLSSLYEHLCNWIYQFYDHQEHPALGLSPESAYHQAIAQTGNRALRSIPFVNSTRTSNGQYASSKFDCFPD